MKTKAFLLTFFIMCWTLAHGQLFGNRNTLPPMPSEIEFAGERVPLENYDTRESLQRELIVTCNMHSSTFRCLLHMTRYLPVIEPILEKYGVPHDFIYLCMAESGLNPNAVSTAGAAGLWQIMPATGKGYGLQVESGVDFRYDVEQSTEVACKHLLDSYKRFGSWTMAAAAYNLGPGGVNQRITKQGVEDYYDAFFPQETLRYVFRVLSFKLVASNPYLYGFVINHDDYYRPLTAYRTIEVSGTTLEWSKLARDNGTTYKMLRELNPWIRDYEYNNKSGKTFKIRVPEPGFRSDPEMQLGLALNTAGPIPD